MGAAVVIQRWAALLHYDPVLRDRVYAGPVEGLAEATRAALLVVDRRAWGVDAQLRGRALDALVEELPATAALMSWSRGIAALDGFFSSPEFHRVVLHRGHMALAFADWAAPVAGSIATVEGAVAAVRRSRAVPVPGHLCRGDVAGRIVPAGTLDRLSVLRAHLGPRPLATLAARRPPPRLAPLADTTEALLIERHGGEVGVASASDALVALLDALPLPRAAAIHRARALGADTDDEAAEILDELIRDGLVLG